MPTTRTTGAAPPPATRRWPLRRLADARIGTKLGLLLLIPLLAAVALAGVRLAEGATRAAEAGMVRSLAAVASHAAAVTHQLHQERVEAINLLTGPGDDPAAFHTRSVATNTAIDTYRSQRNQLATVAPLAETRLAAVDEHLDSIEALRRQILADPPLTPPAASLRYSTIGADILAYLDAVAGLIEDPALSQHARAVTAMSQAARHAAEAHAIAGLIAADPQLAGEHTAAFAAAQAGQQEAFATFRQLADPPQRTTAERIITGGNVEAAADGVATLLQTPTTDPRPAATALAGMVDLTRHAEQGLHQRLLHTATESRDSVVRRTLVESAAVVLALTAAIAVAALLARAMARALARLETTALAVAEQQLPATVAYLADPANLGQHTPQQLAAAVPDPVRLSSHDQIGQVAAAFNTVHRAAIRVAAEQAALRTSVSAMFLNLARRSQTLVDAMISRLDRLQRDEHDPERLRQMFALDSLATRMRRNDENLLVLAGADSSPPRSQDALVPDVLRAAQSEIEHYHRVEFGTVDEDVHVAAAAVNDVVRLVAELLDNATRFSPPHTQVVCEARRLGDQLIIQVEDRGLGMTSDDVDTINAWLASPGDLNVTTFRRMGIAVIARLAARHRVHVALRAHPHHGTTATATLPPIILQLPASRQQAFAPPANRPAPPATTPTPPARAPHRLPRRTTQTVADHIAGELPTAGHQPTTTPRPAPLAPPPGNHAPAAAELPVTDLPVAGAPAGAGRPSAAGPVAGRPAFHTYDQPPAVTVELPIFQQLETAWFRDHGDQGPAWSGDRPPAEPPAPPPASPQYAAEWHTAGDLGWAAAAAAANPDPGGLTPGGLPKRVPAAQLVPGSVPATHRAGVPTQRRTPRQVQQLLSAYQRGVQRAREDPT